jgi:hypothetical protein
MIEILCLALMAVMVKDHTTRMKELGQQAKNYGKKTV